MWKGSSSVPVILFSSAGKHAYKIAYFLNYLAMMIELTYSDN